jgi:hypothetical protein
VDKQQAFSHYYVAISVKKEKAAGYYQRPIPVTPEFRDAVIKCYPQLTTIERKEFCWRVIQHILFSDYADKIETPSTNVDDTKPVTRIILPHPLVALMARREPYDGRFRSGHAIAYFNTHIFPLNETDYNKEQRRARAISPDIDPLLVELADKEIRKPSKVRTVFFHNGKVANLSNYREEAKERAKAAKKLREGIKKSEVSLCKESVDLANFLSNQPQIAVNKIIRVNWPFVEKKLEEMERKGSLTPNQSKSARFMMAKIDSNDFHIHYIPVAGSPRVYAIDATINSLNKELRRTSLAGMIEFDLEACQLAIIAAKWDVPEIATILTSNISRKEGHKDIFQQMIEEIGLGDEDRPLLKATIYSLAFGMTEEHIKDQLSEGVRDVTYVKMRSGLLLRQEGEVEIEGVGEFMADRVLKHPFFPLLLTARQRQLASLKEKGFLVDAFGRQRKPTNRTQKSKRSVLAYIAQSYEVKIMLSILPIIEKVGNQIHIASWLHDGCTIHFGKTGEQERQIEQICKRANKTAKELGIPTRMTVRKLPKPK